MAQTDVLQFEKPILEIDAKVKKLEEFALEKGLDVSMEVGHLRRRQEILIRTIFAGLTAWDKVALARHPMRPQTSDYVEMIAEDFVELHGDKAFGDDQAILAGFGTISGEKTMIVGHRKGRSTAERLQCNFGMANPEGYRKAHGKMKLAEKFGVPVLTMINTPGANPGVGAEERGQAKAIAESIRIMTSLRVPVICCVIGEGGSGGALGIGVGDRLLMMEHSYYSVISPEGCAAILWKDGAMADKAAEALKLTAQDLMTLKVADEVIPEPLGGAHRNPRGAAESLKEAYLRNLRELRPVPADRLIARRYENLRRFGKP